MPNRILRAEILRSEAVDALSLEAEVFYRRLMSVVDDEGRYYANLTTLWTAVFPLKADRISRDQVATWLDETISSGLVVVYEVDGKRYLELQKFGQQRRTESRFPGKSRQKKSDRISNDAQMLINGIANEHLVGVGVGDEVVDEIGVTDEPSRTSENGSDVDFIDQLKRNSAYEGINIDREIGKMKAWLLTPKGKGRHITKRFVVTWLNKIDVPLKGKELKSGPMPISAPLPDDIPFDEEDAKKAANSLAELERNMKGWNKIK